VTFPKGSVSAHGAAKGAAKGTGQKGHP
jgi:hypothetical protein